MEIGQVIIAGGKGSRLGQDKVMLKLGEDTLLDRAINNLKFLQTEPIIVTSYNRKLDTSSNAKIVYDFVQDGGPLSSIYTGLTYTEYDYTFVCACDMPFVKRSVVEYMASLVEGYDVVIPEINGGVETLHAIYSKRAYSFLNKALSLEKGRLRSFLGSVRTRFVSETELRIVDCNLDSLFNIDTLDDYALAEQMLVGREK